MKTVAGGSDCSGFFKKILPLSKGSGRLKKSHGNNSHSIPNQIKSIKNKILIHCIILLLLLLLFLRTFRTHTHTH